MEDWASGVEPFVFACELCGKFERNPLEDGVEVLDWGIGGSDSSNDAPKDDVGLNAFMPANPVV